MKDKKAKSATLLGRRDNQNIGWIFVSPFVVGFVIVFAKMLFDGLKAAFSTAVIGDTGMEYTFNGLGNFHYALRVDPEFVKYALSDLKDMIITIPLVMIFALFVAVVLNGDIWGKTVFRAIFFLPVIISVGLLSKMDSSNAVISTMSQAAVDSSSSSAVSSIGDITTFLQRLEFSPTLINAVSTVADNVVDIVNKSGVQILIFLAGIQSISPSIYEAASVEGATAWEKFWKITLPMVGPMIVVNLVYTLVECLTSDTTKLMSYINYQAFKQGRFGEAAAMSWLYFLAVVIVMGVLFLIYKLVVKLSKASD